MVVHVCYGSVRLTLKVHFKIQFKMVSKKAAQSTMLYVSMTFTLVFGFCVAYKAGSTHRYRRRRRCRPLCHTFGFRSITFEGFYQFYSKFTEGLHPMESIFLNSFVWLEHLAFLLTLTLAINC